jgi:hypothetical protein
LPEDMLNWRLDQFGRPLEILFRTNYDTRESLGDRVKESPDERYQYRYWNREIWQVYELHGNDVSLVDQGENRLGEIPIVPFYHEREKVFVGRSLLKNAAKIGQLVTNWASGLDEALHKQMFAQATLWSRATPKEVGVGVSQVLHLNPEDREDFRYISPDVGPFTSGWESFYQMVALADKMMGLSPSVNKISSTRSIQPDEASGAAKAWDHFEASNRMTAIATNEQEASKMVVHFAARWLGKEEGPNVQYARRYDLSSIREDLDQALSLQTLGAPPVVQREQLGRVTNKMFPSLEDGMRKEMVTAIKAWMPIVREPKGLSTEGGGSGGENRGGARDHMGGRMPGRPGGRPTEKK